MSRSRKGPRPELVQQFQSTMHRFMEAEGRVMRAYFERRPAGRASAPSRTPGAVGTAQAAGPLCPLIARSRLRHRSDRIEIVHRFSPATDLLLDNHRLEGVPVLPAAEAMELMAEAAKRAWPRLELRELRDVQVLRGLVVRGDGEEVRVSVRAAGREAAEEGGVVAEASVSDAGDGSILYYSATLVLGHELPPPPAYREQYTQPLPAFTGSVEEACERHMVHGPEIRSVRAIHGLGAEGVVATVAPSAPARVLAWEPRGGWIVDPVALDTAFQLGWMWARLIHGAFAYPYRFGVCRRYRPLGNEAHLCYLHLQVDPRTSVMHSRLFVVGTDGTVLTSCEGIESALKPL